MGSFIFLPIITRLLTQEEFGIVGTLGPITSLFTVILGLGLYNAQMKKYVDLKDSEDEFGSYMFSSTMIIVVFNVLTYIIFIYPFCSKNVFLYCRFKQSKLLSINNCKYTLLPQQTLLTNLSTTLFRWRECIWKWQLEV